MPRHVLGGLVPEGTVKGRLRGDAVSCLGVQGLRFPSKAHLDMAPPGGVPQGLGQRVRLAPGRPIGQGYLSCRDALAYKDANPPGWRIPDRPPPDEPIPRKRDTVALQPVSCDACRATYHLQCAKLTRVPRHGSWICESCTMTP